MYLLVVEDDTRIANLVQRALVAAGHRVDVVHDGLEGLGRAEAGAYDLVVLDVMIPGMDGYEIARELRKSKVRTPILMLTARDAVADRVKGLDSGADDYLVKPFALEELLARVRALARRPADVADTETLQVGDLRADLSRRVVHRGEREVELTTKEFDLLAYLMRNTGHVLHRSQIRDHVWGYDADPVSNVVDIYVHYLRDKIDKHTTQPLIRTVRGVGYTLKA
jgi:DNA-binding response OmpR family regulator